MPRRRQQSKRRRHPQRPPADDTRPATPKSKPSPGSCTCVNHLGNAKVQHHGYDAALKAILRRHLRYGAHSVYPCPTKPGIFHVTSERKKRP